MSDYGSFEYTYSATEKGEILSIKNKYSAQGDAPSTIDELRRLDRATYRPGKAVGWIMGVVGTLVFGTGMSMVMVWNMLVFGSAVGLFGMATAISAYPTYKIITKRQKKKNAPIICQICEKLLDEKNDA